MCFDMLEMLNMYAPDILQQSLPILKQEGILIDNNIDNNNYEVGKYTIPDSHRYGILMRPNETYIMYSNVWYRHVPLMYVRVQTKRYP